MLEPTGLYFPDKQAVSSQPSFRRLQLQSRESHHRSSQFLEAEVDDDSVSFKPQPHLQRNKLQKPRSLFNPDEDTFEDPANPVPGNVGVTQRANFDKPRPLSSRGLSLIENPREEPEDESWDEVIESRHEPRRRASLAECNRRGGLDEMDPPNFLHRRSQSIRVPSSSKGDFQPKRNKSIHSKFSTVKTEENEIWVQTFTGNEDGKIECYFKGLRGGQCRLEPPTGALNIVYLEDFLPGRSENPELVDSIKREMAVPSILKKGKKKSKWAPFLTRCKSFRKLGSI
ncbi:MAG: hypothetical protein SGBAC_003012 [Bacillariaceae sp.]